MINEESTNSLVKFSHLFFKFSSISIVISLLNIGTSLLLASIAPIDYFNEYVYLQSIFLILLNITPLGVNGALVAFYKEDVYDITLAVKKSLELIIPISSSIIILSILTFNTLFNTFENILSVILISIIAYLFSCILLVAAYFQVTNDFIKAGISLILSYMSYFTIILLSSLYDIKIENALIIIIPILMSIALVSYIYINRAFKKNNFSYKSGILRPILRFSIPNALHATVSSFLIVSDRLFLKDTILADDFKTYSLALLTCSIILFIVNNFAASYVIFLVRSLRSSQKLDKILFFKKNQFRALLFFLIPFLFFPVFLLSEHYFNIENMYFIQICILTSISYSFWAFNKIYLGYLNYYKDSAYILKITTIGAVSYILLSIFFKNAVPTMVLYPLSLLIASIIMMIFLRRKAFKYIYEDQN